MLEVNFPAQGWRQFLAARKEMLDSYDDARAKSLGHQVQTFHGWKAEAEFRRWLQGFLPQKYAVTSGYIVSQGLPDSETLPHFDVIIYNRLESPILWVEGTADHSAQGKARAIPAEYVHSILEVKAKLSAQTMKDGIAHLSQLARLMNGIDAPEERYRLHFPKNFCCGQVFFELQSKESRNLNALTNCLAASHLAATLGESFFEEKVIRYRILVQ